jgi:hypothetical protein
LLAEGEDPFKELTEEKKPEPEDKDNESEEPDFDEFQDASEAATP